MEYYKNYGTSQTSRDYQDSLRHSIDWCYEFYLYAGICKLWFGSWGEALLMFNLPVVFGAVIFYLIARFTSNR